MQIVAGKFYEFHRDRIVSRPGAETFLPGVEIGPEIPREDALRRVRAGSRTAGRDVYTLFREDAQRLARDAYHGDPLEEIHEAKQPTRSGRTNVFFAHFHPAGLHQADGGPGHVFFGSAAANRSLLDWHPRASSAELLSRSHGYEPATRVAGPAGATRLNDRPRDS